MKFTIVSSHDDKMKDLAKATIPNRAAYCNRHGYAHHLYREPIDRLPQWLKVPAMQKVLPNYDCCFYMDTDAIITNQLLPLIEPETDLVFTVDINGMNCGMFYLRNSDWSNRFLRSWWEAGARFQHYPCPEQTALAYLLYAEPKEKWQARPQREFNSFDYSYYNVSYEAGQYQPGDFILHLPALPDETRIKRFTSILTSKEERQ